MTQHQDESSNMPGSSPDTARDAPDPPVTAVPAHRRGRIGGPRGQDGKYLRLFSPTIEEFAISCGLQGDSWKPTRSLLKAAFGERLSEEELQIFRACTKRENPPDYQVRRVVAANGRRAAKTRSGVIVGAYLASTFNPKGYTTIGENTGSTETSQNLFILAPGETAVVMLIATDRAQARVAMQYARGIFETHPVLSQMVAHLSATRIELKNRVRIEIHTASFKVTRGYTVLCLVADELGYWRDETSAAPDAEILAALEPAMATIPRAMLWIASNPYARKGELHRLYQAHHGREDSDTLVWSTDTRTMNPLVPASIIERAFQDDPSRAMSEYGRDGEIHFRSDIETFVPREVAEAAVIPGRFELPRARFNYRCFVDPSGGSSDSFTMAIAHRDRDRVVLDLVREVRPKFSPESVVQEFSQLVREYGQIEVVGDRYAGEWPREQFRKHGVQYRTSDRDKSSIYLELVPMLNSGRIELLDVPRLLHQLCSLERRSRSGGKDTIDHPVGMHDDLINAAAGALVLAQPTNTSRTRVVHWG